MQGCSAWHPKAAALAWECRGKLELAVVRDHLMGTLLTCSLLVGSLRPLPPGLSVSYTLPPLTPPHPRPMLLSARCCTATCFR